MLERHQSDPVVATAVEATQFTLDLSSTSASGRTGALRVRRMRGQREPLSVFTVQPPTPETAPLLPAATVTPVARKHAPVASGPGLKLDLQAIIKQTLAESQQRQQRQQEEEYEQATYMSHRRSESDVPALIRKKSGEVVKSSLKPFRAAGPDGLSLHLPSPSKSGFTTPASPGSPEGSPPRGRLFHKSCPTTPTASKFVHFDAQLERVKLFLAEQKPAAVSRDGSPTEDSDTSGTERGRRRAFPFGPQSPSSEDDRFRALLSLRVVNCAADRAR